MAILLPFVVYVLTAAPMVAAGDAGELVAAAFCLGIPHPPGYPLLTMTGKAASMLPFGDVAFRLNVLSGMFGSASVYLAYLSVLEVSGKEDRWTALGMALAAGFTSTVWGIAVEAEAYSGNLALVFAAIYLALRWRNGHGDRFILASAFMAGLAVCGHYSAVVVLPGLAVMLLFSERGSGNPRLLAMSATMFGFGLSLFMLLPIRAYSGPEINWGRTDGYSTLLYHLTRAKYGDLQIIGRSAEPFGLMDIFVRMGTVKVAAGIIAVAVAVAAAVLLRRRGLPGGGIVVAVATVLLLARLSVIALSPGKLEYFAGIAGGDYWWVALALAVTGLYAVYRRDRGMFVPVCLIALCMSVVYVYRIPVMPDEYMLPVSDKIFAPWSLFTAVLAGAGAVHLSGVLARAGGGARRFAGVTVRALPLAFACLLLFSNASKSDMRYVYWPHDYARDMDRTIRTGSLFMSEGDHHPFFSIYLKVVEGSLEDVQVLELNENIFPGYDRFGEFTRYGAYRTVFCSQEAEIDPFPGVEVKQAGILNVWADTAPADWSDPVQYYIFRAARDEALHSSFMNRSIYSNYKYHMGRRLAGMGLKDDAMRYFDDALYAGDIFPWLEMNVGNVLSSWGLAENALARYRRVIELTPGNYLAYANMANVYLSEQRVGDAKDALLKASVTGKGIYDPSIYQLLAEIAELEGNYEEAALYWEAYASRPGADRSLASGKLSRFGRFR